MLSERKQQQCCFVINKDSKNNMPQQVATICFILMRIHSKIFFPALYITFSFKLSWQNVISTSFDVNNSTTAKRLSDNFSVNFSLKINSSTFFKYCIIFYLIQSCSELIFVMKSSTYNRLIRRI